MPAALVTLLSGPKQAARWNKHCREGWQAYAQRHGLELLVLDKLIDEGPRGRSRSPAWQKLLLSRVNLPSRYEQVAWVDPDIVVSAAKAPNLFEHLPPGRIGAVRALTQFDDPLLADAFAPLRGSHRTLAEYTASLFAACGLAPQAGPLVSTGLVAFATRELAWMEEIYERREPAEHSFQEQVFLSHEIARRGLFHELDPRYGVPWSVFRYAVYGFAGGALDELKRLCLGQLLTRSYCLDLRDCPEDLVFLDPGVQMTGQTISMPAETLLRIAVQFGEHCTGRTQDMLLGRVARWKRAAVTEILRRETQDVVFAGPFRGMRLPAEVCWGDGDIAPKLLGSYEAELHPPLESVIRQQPKQVIMVGCSEGYYPVGLARRLPATAVWAFDTSPKAQEITKKAAELNQVAHRVRIEGTCTPARLAELLQEPAGSFLLVDCEGFELELLDVQQVPSLAKCQFIVECHDFLGRPITPLLRQRFAATHQVVEIGECGRDPNQHPIMRQFHSIVRWIAVSENRPTFMNWLLCNPK